MELILMTNSLKGRTYVDHEWVVRPGATMYWDYQTQGWRYRKSDVTLIQTPHVVPNGLWVMETPYCKNSIIGVTDELRELWYIDKHSATRTLFINPEPFGCVTADGSEVVVAPGVGRQSGRLRLSCARQIHQSELGRTVPIPRINYVRQAFESGQKPNVRKPRERRRSNLGWVRLTDLATAANMNPADIVQKFWMFSGHLNHWTDGTGQSGQNGSLLLDMIMTADPADIAGKYPSVISANWEQSKRDVDATPEIIWVRRGFAYTVLRLLALGYEV